MSYIINLSSFYKSRRMEIGLIGVGKVSSVSSLDEIFNFESISVRNNISNFSFFIRLFFSRTIRKIRHDEIIHVHRPEMVIPIKLRTKNIIICTLHGGQDLAVFQKKSFVYGLFYSILLKLGFLLADQLIAVDRKNYERYKKKYPWVRKKITLIPIGVNTELFRPLDKKNIRIKFGISQNEKIILFVGRLEFEKNIDFLIKCFKAIPNKDNYTLLIVGDGSLRKELEDKASDEKKIKFFGEIPNREIVEVLNVANALALPSRFEGSPTIVKEALSCNLPVIATDVGDVKEVLQLVSGGEIIRPTLTSFLGGLEKILSSNKFDIGSKIFHFRYEMMAEKTLKIYENFLSKELN